ncbi:DUF6482 family protein [Agarivorans sp. TSD2052]|nr:DUF6482 family protein [Agarivorans sp. TSD2052]
MDLIINSHEGDIYLVCEQAPDVRAVTDYPYKHTKRFSSLSSIKQHYQQQSIDKVWLIQHSAYDEMCGLPNSSSLLKMELSWPKH